ncbi:alpha/beta hydrolase family protein [Hymenobacter ruricola]|uniref:Alpha/beta fold hydrolase n=1 Tax=Hymenobacter ruricola TaxID=2791023 RepID=A0ABS0IAW3_9BACT|nr:alpha/beta fold hydrolase [Hymenobacter ruricola]MBF9224116.1 alpha/beta fold hydrolase [Hymenobacter ruricola]
MMRFWGLLLLLLGRLALPANAQTNPTARTVEEFGYRRQVVMFGRDSVQVLLLSKPGEEKLRKPLLLWVQGSLPTPLLLYDQRGAYPVFPFHPKKVLETCHLAIVSKPGIPLTADVTGKNPNVIFQRSQPPAYYCARNYLDYYVRRDEAVLRFLKKQPWVEAGRVVIGGHSQGTAVVAHLAAVPGLVSRAVYLSGNPLGRLMSMLAEARQEADTAAVNWIFRRWQAVVADPARTDCQGDDPRNTYGFAASELPVLLRTRVPVFVGFGTLDHGVAGDDYLRLEATRQHRTNFTFREYPGREHNFFGFKDGQINYDDFYWDQVGEDFLRWAGLWPR